MISLSADSSFLITCFYSLTPVNKSFTPENHTTWIRISNRSCAVSSWKVGGRLSDKIRSLGIQIQRIGIVTAVSELE